MIYCLLQQLLELCSHHLPQRGILLYSYLQNTLNFLPCMTFKLLSEIPFSRLLLPVLVFWVLGKITCNLANKVLPRHS